MATLAPLLTRFHLFEKKHLPMAESPHKSWWHAFWNRTAVIRITSKNGSGEYLESLRNIYLFAAEAEKGDEYRGSQAGVVDMLSSARCPSLGILRHSGTGICACKWRQYRLGGAEVEWTTFQSLSREPRDRSAPNILCFSPHANQVLFVSRISTCGIYLENQKFGSEPIRLFGGFLGDCKCLWI